MRVAVLVSSAEAGGAERVAINLANQFAARGEEADLVLVDAVGKLLGEVSPKVNVVDLRAKRARYAIMRFRRYLSSQRPNAVLAISYEMNIVAALAAVGLTNKPRLVMTVHNPLRRMQSVPLPTRLLTTFLSKMLYRRADHVVAVSDGVATDLVESGWAKPGAVLKIHNAVLSADLDARANEPLPPHIIVDSSLPTIVTVGRLFPQKNHALLLDAFDLVRKSQPARLLIVGEGPCRSELERHITRLGLDDAVQLVGFVANPYPIVRAANLFVLSSDHEGCGNVIVEALAVGTPVVSTDCPHGPRDILEGGKWGKLVPPGNPQSLADAMLDARSNARIDARERAGDFSVEASAERYLDLF